MAVDASGIGAQQDRDTVPSSASYLGWRLGHVPNCAIWPNDSESCPKPPPSLPGHRHHLAELSDTRNNVRLPASLEIHRFRFRHQVAYLGVVPAAQLRYRHQRESVRLSLNRGGDLAQVDVAFAESDTHDCRQGHQISAKGQLP